MCFNTGFAAAISGKNARKRLARTSIGFGVRHLCRAEEARASNLPNGRLSRSMTALTWVCRSTLGLASRSCPTSSTLLGFSSFGTDRPRGVTGENPLRQNLCTRDRLVHIIVSVLAEPPTDQQARNGPGPVGVFFIQQIVGVIGKRIFVIVRID